MANNFIGSGAKEAMSRIYRSFINLPQPETPEKELLNAIENARREYKFAESRFNEATRTELIDQAVYDMLAAQTKYSYLMKVAKERDLSI